MIYWDGSLDKRKVGLVPCYGYRAQIPQHHIDLYRYIHIYILQNQRRKDPEKTPYINHPVGVANYLVEVCTLHPVMGTISATGFAIINHCYAVKVLLISL